MTGFSDRGIEHLRRLVDDSDVSGTRYEIAEEIGRGGMGIVFRAHDPALGRDVALKVVSDGAHDEAFSERVVREAAVLARLEHPGIVPVYDAGTLNDGRVYYVMRLVRGVRLDEFVATAPARGEVMRHFLRICEAVAYAHRNGVVHRDLKPMNIMIGPLGETLILDWGIARVRDHMERLPREGEGRADMSAATEGITEAGAILGTPGFMAPEQALGNAADADERADVFGLGAILRFLLSGSGDKQKIPAPLASIVARATAPDREQRYATAVDLADDVRRWMDGEPVSAHAESAAEMVTRLYRRHQTLILLFVGYALVRMAIFVFRRV